MTNRERIGRLEDQIRGFNAIISGVQGLQGGFPALEKKATLEERIAQIKMAHENFAIRGDGVRATCEGNLKTGCAVNFKCPDTAASGAGGVVIPPPPTTGACCFDDGTCVVETEAQCSDDGGTYQGNGTDCDPNPCPLCPRQPSHVVADFSFDLAGFHNFSGSGTIDEDLTFGEPCIDNLATDVFVTVHETGNPDCAPDASVSLNIAIQYNVGTDLWDVYMSVLMADHATTCGGGTWPPISILSDFSDSFIGPTGTVSGSLVAETAFPMTGTVSATFT